jgi:Protein of unknown function (DUF3106)
MNNSRRSLAVALLLGLAALTAAPSFAQEAPAAAPPAPVAWSSLSPVQQQLLSRSGFASQWSTLPPARQQALAHGSERWLGMSDGERAQARERFARWRALPPEQRQALRSRWQKFQALSPSERETVRENFHRFQQLPPERRQMLRQQWRNATPEQRLQMVQHAREQRQRRQMQHPAPHPQHH